MLDKNSSFRARLRNVFCYQSIKEALISATIWFVIWLVGFWITTYLGTNGASLKTTFRLILIALLLGHMPKFVAIFLGTDTDFQGVMRVRPSGFQFVRGGLALVPLAVVALYLLPSAGPSVDKVFYAFDILEISSEIWGHIYICISLFAAQFVFSWPSPDEDLEERQESIFVSNDDTRLD